MYIILNKRVMHALNLNVSDIRKFDKESLIEIYRVYSTSCSDRDYEHCGLIYKYANSQKWFEKNISYINYNEDTGIHERIYDFEGVHDGYYFIVDDGRYVICSKLYETEKEAEHARDNLLKKANRIIARLYKVNI